MSDLFAALISPKTALSASTAKTILELTAPANHRIKIVRWGLFFDEETGDATPATPLLAELLKSTVTGTGTAAVPILARPASEVPQSTAKDTITVEGTLTDVYDSSVVNAQTGYEVIFPVGQEVIVAGGAAIAIRVTPGAVVSTGGLNVVAKIWFEE